MRSVRSKGGLKFTEYIKPMLAQIHEDAFDHADWIFEIKWDGYRAVSEIGKGKIRLYSRNGLSFEELYPKVVSELKTIKEEAILDGEIIALNEHGKPDFQKLQQFHQHKKLSMIYYVFDCLSYKGKSLMNLPLIERKKIAQKIIPPNSVIKYSDHVSESGIEFFTQAAAMDLEGIIAKRAASTYTPGKRSPDWLKIKNHNTQEAIIVGYTAPRGGRQYFGALILALMDRGKLKYIGHTGTGFTEQLLKELYKKLQPLETKTPPFEKKIAVNSPVTWVRPVLVCNVKFTEITSDGILRHPVFMGLRIDKTPAEITTLDVGVKGKKSE
jgi:bifunctional non-homologous end joining protein LigD